MKPMPLIPVLAVIALLASACASTPPVRHYVVTALPVAATATRSPGPVVVVAAVRLPEYLERAELVTRGGDNRLQLQEFDQWGGSLTRDLTRVMAENLSALLGSDGVVAAPHSLRLKPDYRLEIEVLRFERAEDRRVHLAARWWLQRGAEGAPVTGTATALASEPLAEGTGAEGTVAAMSRVYGDLARAIALAISRHEKGAS